MKISGIYKIQSIIKPKRIYIGSANDVYKRWSKHVRDLLNNKHHNHKLQNHFNKYSHSDLTFCLLDICTPDELIRSEQSHIDKLKPYFNECQIAGSSLGIKRSEDYKKMKSEAMKGNKNGFKPSLIPKIEKTDCCKYIYPEERKAKMRNIALLKGFKPPDPTGNKHNLGKHHSQETKDKMSDSQKLRRLNEAM